MLPVAYMGWSASMRRRATVCRSKSVKHPSTYTNVDIVALHTVDAHLQHASDCFVGTHEKRGAKEAADLLTCRARMLASVAGGGGNRIGAGRRCDYNGATLRLQRRRVASRTWYQCVSGLVGAVDRNTDVSDPMKTLSNQDAMPWI